MHQTFYFVVHLKNSRRKSWPRSFHRADNFYDNFQDRSDHTMNSEVFRNTKLAICNKILQLFAKASVAHCRKSRGSPCHLSQKTPHCSGCGCECERCHVCHICEIEFLTLRFSSSAHASNVRFHPPASNLLFYPPKRSAVESQIGFPITATNFLLCQA